MVGEKANADDDRQYVTRVMVEEGNQAEAIAKANHQKRSRSYALYDVFLSQLENLGSNPEKFHGRSKLLDAHTSAT